VPEPRGATEFWNEHQPGFRFSAEEVGTPEFFAEVERHRYALEPHIPEVVGFHRWKGCDVLEAGCGMGTDGSRFARAGASYTGLDISDSALALARRRFDLMGCEGSFVRGSVTDLPFADRSFDLVYSHGIIHHVADTERAVAEFHRVLRPQGTALVMVYHQASLNYWFNIMVLRRAMAPLLALPGAPAVAARLTGEDADFVAGHRGLLAEHGARYLLDAQLFLSKNTDGPANPLSKSYTRADVRALFRSFADVKTHVRYLNLRLWPAGERLAHSGLARRLEHRIGWHLYAEAQKDGEMATGHPEDGVGVR
jgi:SAM-dependent methyltransferase